MRPRGEAGDVDKPSYAMSECDGHCGLVSLGKSCVGHYVVKLGFVGQQTLDTEKTMAPHSSTLAWKLPWMEEPGGLQSMGSLRVGHN